MRLNQTATTCLLAMLVTGLQAAETRFHQYTKKYHTPDNAAEVVAAGYLGSDGDEYLSAAAVSSDGTVYVAGNALGPSFALNDVRIQVLGRDTQAPNFTMPSRGSGNKRKISPPKWTHTNGAGFIVRLNKRADALASAVRFPWGAGSITDMAADDQGGLYVSGVVGEQFTQLIDAPLHAAKDIEGPGELFVGRLKDDLSGFVWCYRLADNPEQPPKLRVLDDGLLAVTAVNAHHLQRADGALQKSRRGSLFNSWVGTIDPQSFIQAAGEMRNTSTGYEPWRQPFLHIHDAESNHLGHFYQWSSRLVGMNYSRLVSDSSVQGLQFDHNGNLLVYGWSDGGNSVFEFAPYDLKTAVRKAAEAETGRKTGLGFSTWGASVGSFAHIIRINPHTGAPLAKANFTAYLQSRNKPSSMTVRTIDPAVDDSVLLSGSSAFGLIETGGSKVNTLDHEQGDYIGKEYVAVLNEAMSNIRFSSAIPGGGQVKVTRYSKSIQGGFATTSARVGGKTRIVFVGGAKEHEKFKPVNNVQKRFAGGDLDGQYVILEMDTLEGEMFPYDSDGTALSAATVPEAGESQEVSGTYQVSAGMKRDSSLIVLRDGGHRKWPIFYMAKPQGDGSIRDGKSGSFTLHAAGDQVVMGGSRSAREWHVGGHLGQQDGEDFHYPEVSLEITVTSNTQATAKLSYQGTTVTRQGAFSVRPSKPVGKGVSLSGVFEFTKKELGLSQTSADAGDPVYLKFWAPGRP